MRVSIMLSIVFMQSFSFCQSTWTDKSRVLPDKLRELPVGLFIYHDTNPNYPEINTDKEVRNTKYVWKHSTTVFAKMESLEVIEAGSYIWYDESGWKENMKLSPDDFKEKFQCTKAILQKGEEYTFVKNYRYGNHLYGGDALWYVLAEDENGKIYKGYSIIETESTLINKSH